MKLFKRNEREKTTEASNVETSVKDEIDELFERGVRVITPSDYNSRKDDIFALIGVIAFFVLMILFV